MKACRCGANKATNRPMTDWEHLFDTWSDEPGYPSLYRVDRPVLVDVGTAFPGLGQRMTGVPMWVRAGAARFEPWMRGRQVAWLRCFDNSFLGAVVLPVRSANARSSLMMTLWLPPDAFRVAPQPGTAASP